jgi:hypothetical protein
MTRESQHDLQPELLFGCADKPAEKHYWLICCERKILFRLKKNKLKKTDYKLNKQGQCIFHGSPWPRVAYTALARFQKAKMNDLYNK